MSQNDLLSEFKQLTKEDWLKKAEKDLKGKPIEELSSNWYGININPYYSIEDLADLPLTQTLSGNKTQWINYVSIEVVKETKANGLARKSLLQGATGVLFKTNEKVNFNTLLNGIDLTACAISFTGITSYEEYFNYVKEQNGLTNLHGFIDNPHVADVECAENFFPTLINGESNNEVEELVEILVALTKLLAPVDKTKANLVISNIAYQVSMRTNYFFGIAKIRALRVLLSRFYSAYNLVVPAGKFYILAKSNSWRNPGYEPHENMLKATTAAMAAISGGCNALLIAPGYTDEQEELVAKNISSLLEFESYLGKVADPAAGSYFIEKLTNELVNKVWNEFKNSLAL